jgi:prepilin-type N-terminal cleavage/methylation domain-containing protein/prepilin-type processing-associated H-X9-DG protein
MNTRTHRRGFTLIELLVVIAIIAILAAILFPVFAQARAKARQTSCLSNLKQINLAFQMYKQDYDETLPYWNWWYSSDAGGCPRADRPEACKNFSSLWINAIYPYEKNAQIYNCPSDRGALTAQNSALYWWFAQGTPVPDNVMVNTYFMNPAVIHQELSYGANELLLNGTFGSPKDSLLPKPAQTMLVADSITSLVCCWGGTGQPDKNNPNDPRHRYLLRRVAYANQCDGTWYNEDSADAFPQWDGPDCTRHNAGENIGYADGHVKFQRVNNITRDLYFGDYPN